ITDSTGSALVSSHVVTLYTASNDVVLDSATDDFDVVDLLARNVTIADANALTLGNFSAITLTGGLNATAGDALNVSQSISAGGAVSLKATGTEKILTVTGGMTLSTTRDGITLEADKMALAGNVTATSQNVSLLNHSTGEAINL